MPPEAATQAPPATQANPQQTAANVAKGVQDKAAGKSSAQGTQAPAKGTPPQTDPNAGKQKFVVSGKEYWLTPEQAAAYVQKGIAFEPKVSQLDRMQREWAQFEQTLLNNPGQIIANVAKRSGKPLAQVVQNILSSNASDDVKEATGMWYWENVGKRMKMDPKDLAILERDEKIANFEKTEEQKKQMAVAQENQARFNAFMSQTKAFIAESMKKSGFANIDAPHAIEFAKVAAGLFISAKRLGRGITPDMAVEAAHKVLNSYVDSRDEALDDEAFIGRLGDKRVKRVQAYLLKKAKEAGQATEKEPTGSAKTPRGERKVITPDEMHDYLSEIKRTGSIPGK